MRKRVAIVGGSHSDPNVICSNLAIEDGIGRYNYAVLLAEKYPDIDFHVFARGAHGVDYIDLCLKHIINSQQFDLVLLDVVTMRRFMMPLNDIVKPHFVEHKIYNNLTQVHLVSNRLTVSISTKKHFTSELNEVEDPIKLSTLWEHTRVGSLSDIQVKEFVDFLPQYAKLIPIVYWTYEGRQNITSCNFAMTGQEYMINKLGKHTLEEQYTSDTSHLNKEGSTILLNEYLLSNDIFRTILEE